MSVLSNKFNSDKIGKNINKFFKIDIVQEYLYAGLGSIAFIILFSLLPSYLWTEPYIMIIFSIIIFSFFLLFIIINQPNSTKKLFAINYKRNISLFTIFNVAILAFLFYQTDYGYGGLIFDNFYRTAYITKMANSGYPKDFTFKGYSAFMAPLYWYILALFALIFQIEPYKMIKFGFLCVYYILPILLYEIWKKIFDEKKSFFITLLFFTFVANYYEIIWIDHLVSYVLFIPFFIYYFENFKNRDFNKKDYILAGLIGSFIFCTFYLYFILIPIYLVIILIKHYYTHTINLFKEKLKRILNIGIFILLFSSWYLIPLAINMITIGYEMHQNNFFPKYALDMPFEAYISNNLLSFVLILGVFFIVLRYNKSKILTILGNLVISVYILYLLGYIGLLIGFPLVHFRVLIVSHYILVISFALFYIEFFNVLHKHEALKGFRKKINIRKVEIFFLILIVFYQNYENTIDLYKSNYYNEAINEKEPKHLINVIKELDDYENKVFLLQYYEVAAYLPINLFISHNSHFSHPSGLNNERVRFLQELADCEDSEEFYKTLMKSKFGRIDYFFLEPNADNATKFLFDNVELEEFPERLEVQIYFRAELFRNSNYFKELTIDNEIIFKTKY